MAEFVATMRIEACRANDSFDAFDPAALKRTRDLLGELGRPGQAIALQRQILRFTGEGPEQLPELMRLADLCLDGGQPLAAIEDGGRRLLATYLNRKWGASIHVHPNMASASNVLARLIEGTTANAQEVRTSLAFGVAHGVCAVYVRKQGEEALFFFDSMTGSGETAEVNVVQEALRKTGRKIAVYRQAIPTQTDSHSCFVQSMKAALTFTRRIPGEDGTFGDFLVPDLIGEMERTSTGQSSFDPFIPTPGLPEVAKMAQGPMLLNEHLAARPDGSLRDTRRGLSLKEFVHSHVVRIENAGKPVAIFDYTRQKGLRYASGTERPAQETRGIIRGFP